MREGKKGEKLSIEECFIWCTKNIKQMNDEITGNRDQLNGVFVEDLQTNSQSWISRWILALLLKQVK